MAYEFATTFGAASFARFAPGWQTDDWALYCDAIGTFVEYLYVLVNDSGPDDGTLDFVPGWGALLDVTNPNCYYPYLAQFVGVQLTGTETPQQAQQMILAESGQKRGTVGAVQSAIARNISPPWQPSAAYAPGDGVSYVQSGGTVAYYVAQGSSDFTSGPTFEPDVPTNLVTNPSFEYDTVGEAPALWTYDVFNGSQTTFEVSTSWAESGKQSLLCQTTWTETSGSNEFQVYTPTGTGGISITGGDSYAARATVNITDVAGATVLTLFVQWCDADGATLTTTELDIVNYPTNGVYELETTGTAPSNAAYACVCVEVESGQISQTLTMEIDSVMFCNSQTLPNYGDGDSPPYVWSGTVGDSTSIAQFTASVSPFYEILERTTADGGPDAYQFVVVVSTGSVGDAAQLTTDINNVKPAGVFWTLVTTDGYTWSEAENEWSQDSSITWAQAGDTQP